MFALHGTGIGGGIVVGRAVVLESRLIDVPRYRVEFAMRLAETSRLARAVETVRAELRAIAEHLPPDAPSEAQALLQVHAMILDDPSLAPQATVAIESHGQNAEWAFASQAEHLAAQFEQFDDPYLRERGRDVTQVADRVLKALAGSGRALRTRAAGVVPLIFVAHDVSPADMLQLKHAGGFAIDLGGTASHTAILARSMNVPAVVGLGHASQMVRDDDWLVLDGESGVLIVAPDEAVLDEYRTGWRSACSSASSCPGWSTCRRRPATACRSSCTPTSSCPPRPSRRSRRARPASACSAPSSCS